MAVRLALSCSLDKLLATMHTVHLPIPRRPAVCSCSSHCLTGIESFTFSPHSGQMRTGTFVRQ